jgi:cytochrome P450
MFEGHDTTSAAVVWSLFILGCHQDVQQRCYEEILTICGPSGDVNMEELGKLTYLECCVKEILRLYPSVPFITRTLGKDANIGGHKMPADSQVMINIYLIHRDPEQWDDPEIFNPDRLV